METNIEMAEDIQIGSSEFILSRDRPIYKTKVTFKDGTISDVWCNEWPEVRDGWVIIAILDKYKTKAKKRYYYHREDVVSVISESLDSNEV